ncbi:S66 family peptidase [[Mycoplasma] gypis]|uniref:S66 peptidase family protein n=1 Tax=[Mycoplasma] gypis TaxID=92404 RepID=A0ABZ2RQD5_9BACT|nr:S66 peptidase family protein [[Mycoplasma] gypis]MBN0919599.1 LD-carboxypeptidase [[Mycoplasma] gypis]
MFKLQKGDEVRVIAPAKSLKFIGEVNTNIAIKALEDLGLKVTFGKNVMNTERRLSASISDRVSDIHDAYKDKNVKMIFTVIGGFNSNQLLPYLDWDLIKNNPKPLCGYSDITSLLIALKTKTNSLNFYGPHFSSFAMIHNSAFIKNEFKKMVLSDEDVFEMGISEKWSDDTWFINQEKRDFVKNSGGWIINEGQGTGKLFGGNLSTIMLIKGTEYWPQITEDTILFIECVSLFGYDEFERNLVSLIQSPFFKYVKGLMIGRTQKDSEISQDDIFEIIRSKKELENIPVVANLDFGHTMPITIIPYGKEATISAQNNNLKIIIKK